MRTIAFTGWLAACVAASACGEKDDPAAYARQAQKAQEKDLPKREIKKITVPVPAGRKVACESWLDPSKFAAALQDEVTMTDKSASDMEATSVCSIARAGEPPSAKEQQKKWTKENMVLGVLPGDEYCLVHLYCSFVGDEADLRKKCEAAGDTINTEIGQTACVHQTQRAAQWAYAYKTIDTDTTCTLEVMGGPSVTDEPLVQTCTRAALETLTKEGIAQHQ